MKVTGNIVIYIDRLTVVRIVKSAGLGWSRQEMHTEFSTEISLENVHLED
jgi:hypothetical protein